MMRGMGRARPGLRQVQRAASAGLLAGAVLGSACTEEPRTPVGSVPLVQLASVYARTEQGFSTADLFKPKRDAQTEEAIYRAPLILQEVTGDGGDLVDADRFRAVLRPGGGPARFETEAPAVYFGQQSAVLGQNVYPLVSYVWQYPQASERSGRRTQGLRLTLDDDGFPVLVEVLNDSSGLRVVYVARRLEAAAARDYGEPLPGRRFAIERSLEEQPRLVVPAVFEDGPEPSGPMVYLRAGSHDVGAVLCRCMPSQVEAIRDNLDYDLLPLEALADAEATPVRLPLPWGHSAVPGSGETERHGLEGALRWPRGF